MTEQNVSTTRNAAAAPKDARDGNARRDEPALLPPVDVIEDGAGLTLYADLPGVPKDRLDVHVEGETLLIDAELALPLPQDMQASHAGVQRTRYRRTFTLSRELDAGKVEAGLNNGVLRVRIPKAAHAQPRRIAVQTADAGGTGRQVCLGPAFARRPGRRIAGGRPPAFRYLRV